MLQALKFIVIVLLGLPLAACMAVPITKDIQNDGPLEANEGIVYGHVRTMVIDHHGKKFDTEIEPRLYFVYGLRYSSTESLGLKQLFPSAHIFGLFGEGISAIPNVFVAKRLPAGEYSILNANFGNFWYVTDIRFKVEPNKVTYIGTLQFVFQGKRGKHGTSLGKKVRYAVINEYAQATAQFAKTYPDFATHAQLLNLARVPK